jgi:hypothetical protein
MKLTNTAGKLSYQQCVDIITNSSIFDTYEKDNAMNITNHIYQSFSHREVVSLDIFDATAYPRKQCYWHWHDGYISLECGIFAKIRTNSGIADYRPKEICNLLDAIFKRMKNKINRLLMDSLNMRAKK